MSSNSGNLPKNQPFGRFGLDEKKEINDLASRISGEKPELLEIECNDNGCVVSYLKRKQVPPAAECGRLKEIPITKKEVRECLYSAVEIYKKQEAKRIILERVNKKRGQASYRTYFVVSLT